jgi:hypothetical protein
LVFKGFVDFLRNKMNYKGWSIINGKIMCLLLFWWSIKDIIFL